MSESEPAEHPHWHPGPDIVDSDVDLRDPAQQDEIRPHEWDVLAVIALGGVLGAEARYGIGVSWPVRGGAFPWPTLGINVLGSLLLGVLMVLVLEIARPHRLVRPLLGVGVLGGFTTFSTFSVDTVRMLRAGNAAGALGYVVASVALCLLAVYVATIATRAAGQRLAPDSLPEPAT